MHGSVKKIVNCILETVTEVSRDSPKNMNLFDSILEAYTVQQCAVRLGETNQMAQGKTSLPAGGTIKKMTHLRRDFSSDSTLLYDFIQVIYI